MTEKHCFNCGTLLPMSVKVCPNCSEPITLINKYQITGILGKGGSSTVYKAINENQQIYAIKVVSSTSPGEQQQVIAEAEILTSYSAKFSFIPKVYEVKGDTYKTYLVMEFIEGQTVEKLLTEPWTVEQVQEFLQIILSYLSQLHSASIIHRDVKPANIIRRLDGSYVLIDFGIAKQGTATLTVARNVGTVHYTSVEQLYGEETDARSDLYGLGATAYHLLTGVAPTSAVARKTGTSLRRPSQFVKNIPWSIESLVLRLLAVEAKDRPISAEAALKLLEQSESQSFIFNLRQSISFAFAELADMVDAKTRSQNRTALIVAFLGILGACFAAGIQLAGQSATRQTSRLAVNGSDGAAAISASAVTPTVTEESLALVITTPTERITPTPEATVTATPLPTFTYTPSPTPQPEQFRFSVKNNSDEDVCYIYINGDSFEKRVRADGDEDFIATIDEGVYSLEVEDCDGTIFYTEENFALNRNKTWTISGSFADTATLDIENQSGTDLCVIYVNGEAYDKIMDPEELHTIGEFSFDTYDLEAEDCDGNIIDQEDSFALERDRTWTVRVSGDKGGGDNPAPLPVDPISPPPLPPDALCPLRTDGLWLHDPYVWYGPFGNQYGEIFAIKAEPPRLYVWSSLQGEQFWNEPGTVGRRNEWVNLRGTPFDICVDQLGNLYITFN